LKNRVKRLEILARADQLTRLLYNTRADVASPKYMCEVAEKLVKNSVGGKCELKFLKGEEI
jgi:leucyl aminopeptidase